MLSIFHKRNASILILLLECIGVFVQASNTPSLSKSYPITTLINAKWGQTPLYLEIAEYMADENISLFWDYIKDVTELETPLKEYDSESKQYLAVMNILQSRLSTLQLPLLKLIVSMHSLTPRIQTHFQIAEETLRKRNCKTSLFVQVDSDIFCSLNELNEKLRSSSKYINMTSEIYSFDHIFPGSENNSLVVVLYGDLGSEEFRSFHSYLSVEASTGNIQYILRHFIRYKPKQKVRLSGYGVELYLKSTEYKSQDDAPKTDEEENNSSIAYETEVQGFDFKVLKARFPTLSHSLDQLRHNLLQGNEEIAQLKAWEFQDLGLQATAKISEIDGEEALKILQITAHNFPMQARSLLNQKVSDSLRDEVKHNTEVFGRSLNIVPPDGALFINGIFFDADTIDLSSVVEVMRSEIRVLESLHDNKIHGSLATAMLTLDFSSSTNNEFAIDIRDTAIMWVNDIEKDTQYRRWPASVMDLLRPTFPGMLRNIRKNMFNLVLVVDPIQPNDGRNILKLAESFITHMAPVHLGLVFTSKQRNVDNEADYNALICAYNYVTQKKDSRAALSFLTDVFATVDSNEPIKHKQIRNQLKKTFKSISENSIKDILGEDSDYDYGQQLSAEFVGRLGFSDIPQALLNGVPMQKSLLLSESDFEEAIFSEIIQQTSKFQKSVYRGDLTDSDNIINFLMQQPHVMPRLNQRILGNGDSKFLDMTGMAHNDLSNVRELAQLSNRDMTATLMNNVKYFTGKNSGEQIGDVNLHFLTLWIVGNLEEAAGQELLLNALRYVKTSTSVRLAFIPNVESDDISSKISLNHLAWAASQALPSLEATNFVIKLLNNSNANTKIPDIMKDILPSTELHIKMLRVYAQRVLQLQKSKRLIIGNGKTYGPLDPNETFSTDDFGLIDRFNSVHYGNKIRKVLQENINQILDNVINIDSDTLFRLYTSLVPRESKSRFKIPEEIKTAHSVVKLIAKEPDMPRFDINAVIDPASRSAQRLAPILILLRQIFNSYMKIFLIPVAQHSDMPVKNFYRFVIDPEVNFQLNGDLYDGPMAKFTGVPPTPLLTQNLQIPDNWLVEAVRSVYDLDNIRLEEIGGPVHSEFELEYLLLEGHCFDATSGAPPRGLQITLGTHEQPTLVDTIVMANLGYFQLKANPGVWELRLREGKSADIYNIIYVDGPNTIYQNNKTKVVVSSLRSHVIKFRVMKKPSMESVDLLGDESEQAQSGIWNSIANSFGAGTPTNSANIDEDTLNIFSVASGHLYERLLRIMMLSVLKHTKSPVKFWFLKNYLSPQFTDFLPHMAREYGFRYELVQYKWPRWLHQQTEKQRTIWGYKILFLDVLFPLNVRKIIFVDADAIVRTDLKELYEMDLDGAPYAYTPFCDSRKDMEGFRFWKQGYWRSHLMGRRYHISALYVVDLKRFRKIAAGDRLRGQYQALSQDPNSLANLDQDLPNNMIHQVAIKSLPDEWLWCQTWCNDNTLKTAKVIDLCNNPMTKEAKLTAAQRIVPEWKDYDMEIKKLMGKIEDHENLNDHDFISIENATQFEIKGIDSSKKSIHANDEL